MVPSEILEILTCPTCDADSVGLGSGRYPELVCGDCETSYPSAGGVLDMVPRMGGKPVRHYRTQSLYDMIAPWYDVAAPVISSAVWGCPPLRYVDWAHRALGRADKGRLLVNPVGTGLVLHHVHSNRIDFPIVAIDISARMLRRAKARFDREGVENVTLIRAEPEKVPFRDGSFDTVMSLNGLNGFYDRGAALSEMKRVTPGDGVILGSALCRGLVPTADRFLNQYERWGIYPILRSRDFIIEELKEAFEVIEIPFETHGAVLFFTLDRSRTVGRTAAVRE